MRNALVAAGFVALLVAGTAAADEPAAVVNTIKLDLQLSGLAGQACKVEIKPAHPGCKFDPILREFDRIPVSGVLRIDTLEIEAKALNADRNCAFRITITEPEAEPRVFKRNIRLSAAKAGEPTPEVAQTFYLRTTAVAKKDKN